MKINVIGLGPGSSEYILPAALKYIEESDIIIGGIRNIESINTEGKVTRVITNNLEEIAQFLKNNYKTKRISVIASGDPGFFGILSFLRKHFSAEDLQVVPGVSSVQYMFAKIGCSWEDAYMGSLHGRGDEDIAAIAHEYKKAFFLLDDKSAYRRVAHILSENGFGNRTMYIGVKLSYDDEVIIKDKVVNIKNLKEDYKLCVAAVIDEE